MPAWGRLDIAVCNAGGGLGSPAESRASTLDLDQFDAVLQPQPLRHRPHVHGGGADHEGAGAGKIITVSSQAGRRASSDGGYAHYGAAKAAIIMYTKYLAQDLGPHGIQVNCIAPGYIGTGRLMPMFEAVGVDRLTRSVAQRRIGTPEDCAASSASWPAPSPTTSPARSSPSTAAARPDGHARSGANKRSGARFPICRAAADRRQSRSSVSRPAAARGPEQPVRGLADVVARSGRPERREPAVEGGQGSRRHTPTAPSWLGLSATASVCSTKQSCTRLTTTELRGAYFDWS